MTTDSHLIASFIEQYKLIRESNRSDVNYRPGRTYPDWLDAPHQSPRVELAEIAALFGIEDPAALGGALAAGGYRLSRDRSKVNLSLWRWRYIKRWESRRRDQARLNAASTRAAKAWLAAFGTEPTKPGEALRCAPLMRELAAAHGKPFTSAAQLGRWLGARCCAPAEYRFTHAGPSLGTYSVLYTAPGVLYADLA